MVVMEKHRFSSVRRLLKLDRPAIRITRRIRTSPAAIQAGVILTAFLMILMLIRRRAFFSPEIVTLHTAHILFGLCTAMAVLIGLTVVFRIILPAKIHRVVRVLYYLLIPFFALVMSECINKVYIYRFSPKYFILNYILFLLLYSVMAVITGSIKKTVLIMTPVIWMFSNVASYLLMFRGTPFQPQDFLAAKIGMDVAGGYNYAPQAYVILGAWIFLEIMILTAKMTSVRVRPRRRLLFRLFSLVLLVAVLVPFYTTDIAADNGIKPDFWNQARGYANKGTIFNFVLNTKYLFVETPDGYEAEDIDDIMLKYTDEHSDDPGIFESAQIMQAENEKRAEEEAENAALTGSEGTAQEEGVQQEAGNGERYGTEDTAVRDRHDRKGEDVPVVNGDGTIDRDRNRGSDTLIRKPVESTKLAVRETSETDQPAASAKLKKGQTPDIIVIMNETLTDLHVLGSFTTNKDYMPFIRNLTANTIKGNLYMPVNGAGTSNSEFEMLTGDSMGLLPTGSNAYQLYVDRVTPSFTHALKAQGYSADAYHTYYKSGWRRMQVYPLLGFERYTALEDMFGEELVNSYRDGDITFFDYESRLKRMYPETEHIMFRQFISDYFDYQQLIKMYEERDKEKPFYMFNVTMQNHGGYGQTAINFNEQIFTTSTKDYYPQANRFLSLIYESDCAFKELVEYFSSVKEPTMIVMFGDHQPSIETSFVSEIMGKPVNSLTVEETQRRYVTPFIIWTNYSSESGYIDKMSANYLSTLVLQRAGLETTAYNDYLSAMYSELPVIDTTGYISSDDIYYTFDDESKFTDTLNDYKKIIYNHLFDKTGRKDDLYYIKAGE